MGVVGRSVKEEKEQIYMFLEDCATDLANGAYEPGHPELLDKVRIHLKKIKEKKLERKFLKLERASKTGTGDY